MILLQINEITRHFKLIEDGATIIESDYYEIEYEDEYFAIYADETATKRWYIRYNMVVVEIINEKGLVR